MPGLRPPPLAAPPHARDRRTRLVYSSDAVAVNPAFEGLPILHSERAALRSSKASNGNIPLWSQRTIWSIRRPDADRPPAHKRPRRLALLQGQRARPPTLALTVVAVARSHLGSGCRPHEGGARSRRCAPVVASCWPQPPGGAPGRTTKRSRGLPPGSADEPGGGQGRLRSRQKHRGVPAAPSEERPATGCSSDPGRTVQGAQEVVGGSDDTRRRNALAPTTSGSRGSSGGTHARGAGAGSSVFGCGCASSVITECRAGSPRPPMS
jgi:hypothetical protein